jgi:hypothetical protein
MTPLQTAALVALLGFIVAVSGDVPGAPRWLRDERTIWSGLAAFVLGLVAAVLIALHAVSSALPF